MWVNKPQEYTTAIHQFINIMNGSEKIDAAAIWFNYFS